MDRRVLFLSAAMLGIILGGPKTTFAQSTDCEPAGRYYDTLFSVTRNPDVVYGGNVRVNGNFQDLLPDVYLPDNDSETDRPLIILAHQGAFILGDKYAFNAAMGRLASRLAELGYVTASINYRLGVPNIFNITDTHARQAIYRATQDMRAAVRYFRFEAIDNGNPYGIDPDAIVVGGSSAGAIMALHTAYMTTEDEAASQIDTTGLGQLEGSSGNAGYSSEVSAVISLAGAILDTLFIEPGDPALVSAHSPDDSVVPYGTESISFSDSVLIAHGSASVHSRMQNLGISDSIYTFLGEAGHIPFSPNDSSGLAYMDTVFTLVRDFLFDRVACPTSVFVDKSSERKTLKLFPNPSSTQLFIELPEILGFTRSVEILDALGRRVAIFKAAGADRTMSIPIENLPAGIYFAKVDQRVQQFVIMR